jgi:isoquinoline 1-oxidoreductase alpha subunit
MLPISLLNDRAVTTIEAMANDHIGRTVQDAWVEKDVVQCGYCQSGQIMSAVALLRETPHPSDAEIEQSMGGNICRCATYVRIREAIELAAQRLK